MGLQTQTLLKGGEKYGKTTTPQAFFISQIPAETVLFQCMTAPALINALTQSKKHSNPLNPAAVLEWNVQGEKVLLLVANIHNKHS